MSFSGGKHFSKHPFQLIALPPTCRLSLLGLAFDTQFVVGIVDPCAIISNQSVVQGANLWALVRMEKGCDFLTRFDMVWNMQQR